jgi:hypothetical protein
MHHRRVPCFLMLEGEALKISQKVYVYRSQYNSAQSLLLGPPLLRREENKVEGLAYIGLCLTRHYTKEEEPRANPYSISRQTQFDFNEIQDRDYEYFVATNDDGWLVGGGENSESYKLPNPDSAHCGKPAYFDADMCIMMHPEIMRVGTFEENLGGVSVEAIAAAIESGVILIPHIALMPSFVLRNNDSPPEIELKFEMERNESLPCDMWANWQLQFIHNQLFEYFNVRYLQPLSRK